MSDVKVEFDQSQLERLEEVLLGGPLWDRALERINALALIKGDAAAKKQTPVRSGHARRSTVADVRNGTLEGRYSYLDWLDTGQDDTRGRQMKNPRGGYQIRRKTKAAVEAELPELIDRAGREIAEKWAA